MKKVNWGKVLKIIVAVATAIVGAFSANAITPS